jgi:hypothetical protein
MIMPCCGGQRAFPVLHAQTSTSNAQPPHVQQPTVAVFRYEGQGSLTVIGPQTGRKYWFEGAGSELAVDLRDRAAVAAVPKLRQIRIA